jgi:heterodisulfide reductase subunit B
MNFAIQRCCTTPIFLKQYETSTEATLKKLGVGIVDIKEFNCCGYPIKSLNLNAYILCSARNMSLAESMNLDILTFCNCCYSSLKAAKDIMKKNSTINNEINTALEKEGLRYNGDAEIRHFLEILFKDIGIKKLRENVVKSFRGLKIAVHYGCHILRPRQLVQFEAPGTASVFDQLVELTGAEVVPWQTQLDCCGSSVWGIDDDLSMALMEKKITAARHSGARYLCVACPYCQIQFDKVQMMLLDKKGVNHGIPSILYTQLLGLSLGIDHKFLGIKQNEIDIGEITDFL